MKTLITIFFLLLATFACAANKPQPPKPVESIETLRADNEALKAQLTKLQLQFQYQMQVCQAPDMMQATILAAEAERKAAAARDAKKK